MARRWSLLPQRPELANALARQLDVHPVVAHLLINRGVESAEVGQRFLDRRLVGLHDPELLGGASEAASRIWAAARAGKKICIYGDYDVDGMCAIAILVECLRVGGVQARFYVPDRLQEGYGVNSAALRQLRDEGIELVVTVDCGVASLEEAEHARSIGLEYIVTDHHEPKDQWPNADAVVHPRLPTASYPFPGLCGTGVAFKLAWEIARRFSGQRKTSEPFHKFLLDASSLAALGTVCDVVPIADENRVFVYHGLRSLKQAPPLGLAMLMQTSGMAEKRQFDSRDLAFNLGPRLNACGRLGQARLGIELLTTRDPDRAKQIALYLEEENKVRRTLERRILAEARELAEQQYGLDDLVNAPAIVLGSDNWHAGVIGIVASRLVERWHRPCLLVSFRNGYGAGSGRSIPGFDLHTALEACREHLVEAGGHARAAGFRVTRDQFAAFRARFEALAAAQLTPADLSSELVIDLEVPLHVLTPNLIRALDVLEPFGQTNPPPILMAGGLTVVGDPRCVGDGARHLSFRVQQGSTVKKAIAFGFAERAAELLSHERQCCVAFSPALNAFRGRIDVDLQVKDFRPGGRLNEPPTASIEIAPPATPAAPPPASAGTGHVR